MDDRVLWSGGNNYLACYSSKEKIVDKLRMKTNFKYLLAALILCIGLVWAAVFQLPDNQLRLIFCNVGQGDAALIIYKNQQILIDGGPDVSVLSCLSKHMPFWDKTIEIMILTHPHADHLTGLMDVIKRYRVLAFGSEKIEGSTGAYKELVRQLEKNRTKQRFLYQDDKFLIKDGVILQTLWPTYEWAEQNPMKEGSLDINSFSVIELLTYKNFKALFTGDAQALTLEKIDSIIGKIDFLKVPHHSSKTGLNSEILNILYPKIAVISVGKNNKYGHPNPFTLELLKNLSIRTLRTDQVGDIEIISDGKTWKVK